MMYGQMTAGSWIYIGSQGIVQGTYETFAEVGRQHYGGDLAGQLDPDRGPRRHGRRAAAGGDAWPAPRCSRSNASRAGIEMRLRTRYLDAQARRPRRGAGADRAALRTRAKPSRSACSATPPRSCPSWCARGVGPTSSPTRPPRTIPSTAICPTGWTRRAVAGGAGAIRAARRADRARPSIDAPCTSRRCSAFHAQGIPTFDYGNNIRQVALGRGRRRTPSTFPASCPPTSGRCSAAASGRSAGPRCRAIPRTSTRPTRKVKELFPRRTRICTTGSTWRASASPSRACRRASAGSAWASATAPASRSTRWWRAAS